LPSNWLSSLRNTSTRLPAVFLPSAVLIDLPSLVIARCGMARDAVGRHAGAVVAGDGGHQFDGAITELEGLLDDGALDVAVADAVEGRALLVEGDDLDGAELALVLDGAEDGRGIVRPQADQADVLLLGQGGEAVDGIELGLLGASGWSV